MVLLSVKGTFIEDSEGQLIVEVMAMGGQIDTIEELCNEIENAAEFLGVPLSDETVRGLIGGVIQFIIGPGYESSVDELVECLLEKGLIVDRDFPPDSISATGLDNMNIQCAGSPLCARLQ